MAGRHLALSLSSVRWLFLRLQPDMPLIIEVQDGKGFNRISERNEIDASNREIFKRYETIDLIFAELEPRSMAEPMQ
jgi:hypothetical protein